MKNNRTKSTMFANALYSSSNIRDAINTYIASLESTGKLEDKEHAIALKHYVDTSINEKHLTKIRSYFNQLFKLIYSKVDYDFTVEARRKSLISTENKINMLSETGRSPSDIRDFLGFRIIIYGNIPEKELILETYKLMQTVIEFYIEKEFEVCNADYIKNDSSCSKNGIIIPTKEEIDKVFTFAPRVKDYTQFPKGNGYQSLHTICKDSLGKYFEIQIRTLSQHVRAESGSANHSVHKSERYANFTIQNDFDPSKIHIPGFEITENGDIIDFVGLWKSLLIFHRQKTI